MTSPSTDGAASSALGSPDATVQSSVSGPVLTRPGSVRPVHGASRRSGQGHMRLAQAFDPRHKSTVIGLIRVPSRHTWKCRWQPVASPVLPTEPISWPASTRAPTPTEYRWAWLYEVMRCPDEPVP